MCDVCQRDNLTIDLIKPFLKKGVKVFFHETGDGYMEFALTEGDKVFVVTATGDENDSYFCFDSKMPDWMSAAEISNGSLPVVKPKANRHFFMRNGEMVGPMVSGGDGLWEVNERGNFEDVYWTSDGRVRRHFKTTSPHEHDLVEMVRSKVFDRADDSR